MAGAGGWHPEHPAPSHPAHLHTACPAGQDLYRTLPSKTLHMLQYAASSGCHFTHVLKTDDDVYVRPEMLMDIVETGRHSYDFDVQYDGSGEGGIEQRWRAPVALHCSLGEEGRCCCSHNDCCLTLCRQV